MCVWCGGGGGGSGGGGGGSGGEAGKLRCVRGQHAGVSSFLPPYEFKEQTQNSLMAHVLIC